MPPWSGMGGTRSPTTPFARYAGSISAWTSSSGGGLIGAIGPPSGVPVGDAVVQHLRADEAIANDERVGAVVDRRPAR